MAKASNDPLLKLYREACDKLGLLESDILLSYMEKAKELGENEMLAMQIRVLESLAKRRSCIANGNAEKK